MNQSSRTAVLGGFCSPANRNVALDGAVHFVDPDAELYRQRYYRIVED